MRVIGITGRARSGKTTVTEWIVTAHQFEPYAFAAPLKNALRAIFNLTEEQMDGEEKEQILNWLGCSPRFLMQSLGTEWGRNTVRQDLWIKLAERWLESVPRYVPGVVFSDVRFDDEANFVRQHGGILIHVSRSAAPKVNPHESERGVRFEDGDFILPNNGTLDELYERVDDLVQLASRSHG